MQCRNGRHDVGVEGCRFGGRGVMMLIQRISETSIVLYANKQTQMQGVSHLACVVLGASHWAACHLHFQPELTVDNRLAKRGGAHVTILDNNK